MDFFGPYLDPAVRITGPMSPDCRGIYQVQEYFELLFDVVPDLHGRVVDSQVESDEVVYVTVELQGTIGRHAVKLRLRDKLVVRNRKLVERIAKGLPLGMSAAILVTPSSWRAATRLMARLAWSAPAVRPA